MSSTIRLLGAFATLLSLARSASMFCGEVSTTECVPDQAASEPVYGYVPIGSDEVQTLANSVQYISWPAVSTWGQCKTACTQTKDCASFQYTLVNPNDFTPTSANCILYFKSVASYVQKDCSTGGLEQYYDVACPTPAAITGGIVPKNPSTSLVNGTCNGARPWNGNQTQWASIAYQAQKLNLQQKDCAAQCAQQSKCKSYLFAPEFGSMQERYNGTNVGAKNAENICVLISQPVSKYVENGTTLVANQFYDKACPV